VRVRPCGPGGAAIRRVDQGCVTRPRRVLVAVSAPEKGTEGVTVAIDNTADAKFTVSVASGSVPACPRPLERSRPSQWDALVPQVISLSATNRPGLLTAITAAFRDLNLDVGKAVVEGDDDRISDKFYVQTADGSKVDDEAKMADIKRALEVLLRTRSGPTTTRPKFSSVSIQQDANKRELLYTLMGERPPRSPPCPARCSATQLARPPGRRRSTTPHAARCARARAHGHAATPIASAGVVSVQSSHHPAPRLRTSCAGGGRGSLGVHPHQPGAAPSQGCAVPASEPAPAAAAAACRHVPQKRRAFHPREHRQPRGIHSGQDALSV
jgi:hypothetical protein